MAGLLEGKVALITGAANGIGRATAMAAAREGAKVLVVDAVAAGEETAKAIKQAGGEAAFQKCDVTRAAEVDPDCRGLGHQRTLRQCVLVDGNQVETLLVAAFALIDELR